jgi:cytochrome c553
MPLTRFTLGVLFALLLVATSGCQPAGQRNAMPASTQGLENPARNGARIYFTRASERGTAISSSGSETFGGGMMGGYGQWLTCATCHGPEGRGGTHRMHMRSMTAPDIRYAALSVMPELKGRKAPYNIDDFRQTVENGRHPDGEEVKADMPRWKMSEADLADLLEFLKALPE